MRMNIKISPKFHLFHRRNQNNPDWLPCEASVVLFTFFLLLGPFRTVLACGSLGFRYALPVGNTEDWL